MSLPINKIEEEAKLAFSLLQPGWALALKYLSMKLLLLLSVTKNTMFLQSNDYLDLVTPLEILKCIPRRSFLCRYYVVKLKQEKTFSLPSKDSIKTGSLIIEQRFPFSLLGIKRLPKEVLVMTPNYYDKQSNHKKAILAIADLYEGSPQLLNTDGYNY